MLPTRYPDPVFPAKASALRKPDLPRIPFDRTTRKGFSTNSTRTGLAPAPARCSFQRWLTVFVTVFLFITCFYEAGMRVHSDAIDYKTRIAALSSGMGRFSWRDAIRKLTFSGFFFMINVIQFFLNVFFCRLYYIVGFLSD